MSHLVGECVLFEKLDELKYLSDCSIITEHFLRKLVILMILFHFQLKKKRFEMSRFVGDCVFPSVQLYFFQRLFDDCLHSFAVNLAMFKKLDALLQPKKQVIKNSF